MFSTRTCPHTGIVNYFADTEPHFSIGSVVKSGALDCYRWRCHLGEPPGSGVAPDLQTAGRRLIRHYRDLAVPEGAPREAYQYRARGVDLERSRDPGRRLF